jgi:hypothetical protein
MNPKPLTAKHYRILRTLYEASTGECHTSCLVHGLHASAMTLVRRGMIWKQDRGLARPLYGMHPEGIPAAIEA